MRDRHTARYTLQQACAVAGVKPSTARYWFGQGYLTLDAEDERAHTSGASARVGELTVLALAIAARLVAMGIYPRQAVQAARTFTLVGSDYGEPEREPGGLYTDRSLFTALALYPDGSSTIFPVGANGGSQLVDVFFPRWGDGMHTSNGRHEGVTLLLLDLIFRHVETTLDALDRRS